MVGVAGFCRLGRRFARAFVGVATREVEDLDMVDSMVQFTIGVSDLPSLSLAAGLVLTETRVYLGTYLSVRIYTQHITCGLVRLNQVVMRLNYNESLLYRAFKVCTKRMQSKWTR